MAPIQPQPPPPPHSYVSLSYMFAVIAVTLCGVAGIFGILYFIPGGETTQMILAYIGFCGIALTQLVNFIKIADVKVKTQETHLLVNSQIEELKKTIAELEFSKGVTEGISQQRELVKEEKAESALEKEQEEQYAPEKGVPVPLSDAPSHNVVAIPVKKTRTARGNR